eukprot:TRINITY_DN2158_c0_g2_i1.p1 TRINITY_DN2158_c0_g2~~TRINITY_DN2158_c0_g2_i1.p1  ORF type:complete len:849 (+),score=153.41 TRINITY_DN2158_c0_g2_i1:69-2615(+)
MSEGRFDGGDRTVQQIASRFGRPTKTIGFSLTQNLHIDSKRYGLHYRVFGHSSRVTRHAFKRAGFKRRDGVAGWNGMWGRHLRAEQLKRLNRFQKVNHFPQSFELGRKDRLCRNMQRMQRVHGKHYDFFPKSFILPRDYRDFCKETEEYEGPWISKPCASCRGIGIKLVKELDDVGKQKSCIVGRYISNPYLVNELKFDLRIYVAVTSYDPLRIYLYEEGLTRFGTHKYKKGAKHIANRFMHLTNFSVNKHSRKFVSNTDPEADDVGHKWSLTAFRRWMQQNDVDETPVMAQIKDIIIKTLISVESKVVSAVKMQVPHRGNCFEVFGFDILLDDKLKAWLLEVNVSPSLNSEAPIDVRIKGALINDLFNLVGFVAYDRKKLREQQEAEKQSRLTGVGAQRRQSVSWEEKLRRHQAMVDKTLVTESLLANATEEDVEIIRESVEENMRRGAFTRIFPTAETDHYMQFFEFPRYFNMLLLEWCKAEARCPPLQWPPAGMVLAAPPPRSAPVGAAVEDSDESDDESDTTSQAEATERKPRRVASASTTLLSRKPPVASSAAAKPKAAAPARVPPRVPLSSLALQRPRSAVSIASSTAVPVEEDDEAYDSGPTSDVESDPESDLSDSSDAEQAEEMIHSSVPTVVAVPRAAATAVASKTVVARPSLAIPPSTTTSGASLMAKAASSASNTARSRVSFSSAPTSLQERLALASARPTLPLGSARAAFAGARTPQLSRFDAIQYVQPTLGEVAAIYETGPTRPLAISAIHRPTTPSIMTTTQQMQQLLHQRAIMAGGRAIMPALSTPVRPLSASSRPRPSSASRAAAIQRSLTQPPVVIPRRPTPTRVPMTMAR